MANIDSQRSHHPRPALSVWAAGALVVLLVAGGIGFICWQWADQTVFIDSSAVPTTAPRRPGANRGRMLARRPQSRPVQPVRQLAPGVWQIRSRQATVRVVRRRGASGEAPAFTLVDPRSSPAIVEVRDLNTAAWRASREPALAQAMGLSDAQVQKLKAIPVRPSPELSDVQRQNLQTLWAEYESASDKTGAQGKLVAAANEIAQAHLDGWRQSQAQWAAEAGQTLTPEQMNKFREQRNVRRPPATTRAATGRAPAKVATRPATRRAATTVAATRPRKAASRPATTRATTRPATRRARPASVPGTRRASTRPTSWPVAPAP
jgi:hypothetical protein